MVITHCSEAAQRGRKAVLEMMSLQTGKAANFQEHMRRWRGMIWRKTWAVLRGPPFFFCRRGKYSNPHISGCSAVILPGRGRMNAEVILVTVLMGWGLGLVAAQLSVDYYQSTCPQVESIVRDTMVRKQAANPTTAAGTLRIFFHDCFVDGCDASVLISSTANNTAERDADINLSLPGDGFDAVVRAKAAVEAQCLGIVSCADILSIATRDLIALVGGPYYEVKKGRKDGLVSQAARVQGNLPESGMGLDELNALFGSKGFSQAEMVTLSGAHTVGFSHCKEFMNRIYNYSNVLSADPTMNPQYVRGLQQACPEVNLDATIVAFNDVISPRAFDNVFYQNLVRGLGLLTSDQVLYTDERSRGLVESYAADQRAFFDAFVAAMDKLGSLGVKTGDQGEVRRRCDAFNG